MHPSAMTIGRGFFTSYLGPDRDASILDVGGMDVNGSLRSAASPGWDYLSVDLAEGAGVDQVLDDPYHFPFADNTFDAIVSTSCFEHDNFFWLTFVEMCRVSKDRGYVYINAPSNGTYHQYPLDCWRFYPDAGVALAQWAHRCGQNVALCESFIGRTKENEKWNDFVCVFRKNAEPDPSIVPLHTMVDCENIRLGRGSEVRRFNAQPQYLRELLKLRNKLEQAEGRLALQSASSEPAEE